jgi:hypothetical protein
MKCGNGQSVHSKKRRKIEALQERRRSAMLHFDCDMQISRAVEWAALMKSSFLCFVALSLLLCTTFPLQAQDPAAPAPASASTATADLSALQASVLAALNARDYTKLLPQLTPGVVITFQNSEVARGRDGVKTLLEQNTKGPGGMVQNFRIDAKADDTPKSYGESTAVITGSATETFLMANGKNLELDGRWTATVVREEGQWRLAALHTSADIFTNPMIEATKKAGTMASVASLLIGLVVGWVLGRRKSDQSVRL